MRYKQVVGEGEDLPLEELRVSVRTFNVIARVPTAHDYRSRRTPMLSHVVGKDLWDPDCTDIVRRGFGKGILKELMEILNRAGYALGTPPLDSKLTVLPVRSETKQMFHRAGMVHLDHITTRTRGEIVQLLCAYGFDRVDVNWAVEDVEEVLRGVNLGFKDP